MDAYLKHKNKWSEIAKIVLGRSENAVKNRFNILLKKYKQGAAAGKITELGMALQAIADTEKDDVEWIHKLIELKKTVLDDQDEMKVDGEMEEKEPIIAINPVPEKNQKREDTEVEQIANATRKMSLEENKNSKLKIVLIRDDKEDFDVEPGECSCPSLRFIEQKRKREAEIKQKSTRFINTESNQELYISAEGIFLNDPRKGIRTRIILLGFVKYENYEQIAKAAEESGNLSGVCVC